MGRLTRRHSPPSGETPQGGMAMAGGCGRRPWPCMAMAMAMGIAVEARLGRLQLSEA